MVRHARWAGQFYDSSAGALAADLDALLSDWPAGTALPWAILVPHAGHAYSGACAAAAYARVAGRPLKRVLLFGPNHHLPLAGIGLSRQNSWATPLGDIPVDLEAVNRLLEAGDPFCEAEAAQEMEHSLEVQLPFIQRTLPGTLLLPMLVGQCSSEQRTGALACLAELRRPDDLWVVTTDLSHFHDRRRAEILDARAERLLAKSDPADFAAALAAGEIEACGAEPVLLFLEAMRLRGGRVEILDRRDSSLVNGDEEEVVGYISAAIGGGDGDA